MDEPISYRHAIYLPLEACNIFASTVMQYIYIFAITGMQSCHILCCLQSASCVSGILLWSMCIDEMHVLALGVSLYFCASTFWVLVHFSGLRGTFDERLGTIWSLLNRAYEQIGTAQGERIPKEFLLTAFNKQRGPI